MRDFMECVQNSFYKATRWNRDNSYSTLDCNADGLLRFPTPQGLRMTLSSLATSQFATSYELGSVVVVNGSLSYLYSSVPLRDHLSPQANVDPLSSRLRAYQPLTLLQTPTPMRTISTPPDSVLPETKTNSTAEIASTQRPSTRIVRKPQNHDTPPIPPPKEAHDDADLKSSTTMPARSVANSEIPSTRSLLDRRKASPYMMYARYYLPQSLLEALYVKRVSPALQVQLSVVSSNQLRNGGTVLGLAQYDVGRYAMEGLISTDGGLLGFRGIYNFGGDVEKKVASVKKTTSSSENGDFGGNVANSASITPSTYDRERDCEKEKERERERIYGRFTTGAEFYYGSLNKSGGVSFAARFATLPDYTGTPLTATFTLNPLMGNISASYAVVAGPYCSLATRMDFNAYSYESDWIVGMELWRKGFRRNTNSSLSSIDDTDTELVGVSRNDMFSKSLPTPPSPPYVEKSAVSCERAMKAKLEWRNNDETDVGHASKESPARATTSTDPESSESEDYSAVFKARLDQGFRISLLWEGRIKALLFSIGTSINPQRKDQLFRTVGLEVQYSS